MFLTWIALDQRLDSSLFGSFDVQFTRIESMSLQRTPKAVPPFSPGLRSGETQG